MGKVEKTIAEDIRDIVDPERGKRFAVYSGKVVPYSVDRTNGICSVERSVDDAGSPVKHVLLNVTLQGTDGIFLYPMDGADVLVAEVDGPGKYCIIKASSYYIITMNAAHDFRAGVGNNFFYAGTPVTKMVFRGSDAVMASLDGVQLLNGNKGGMVMVSPMTTKIAQLQAQVNTLKAEFAAVISSLTTTFGGPGGVTPVLGAALLGAFTPFTPFASSMLTVSTRADFENTKCTHGV
jgi:hypothetical protein